MIGSQAFIAFTSDGSLVVNTYNISSYKRRPKVSKLSFDVWDLGAESDGKNIVIFASVKLPENAQSLNQVWQVGTHVRDGVPRKHHTADANKKSTGLLELVATSSPAPSGAPGSASAPTPSAENSGSFSGIGKLDMILFVGLFVLLGI